MKIVKIVQILEQFYIVHAKINDDIIEYEIKKDEIELLEVHTSCIEGVDDLLMLGDFNEPTLLQNTRARFYQDKIYSFIGNPILIAVNPYKKLDIYNNNYIKYFRDFFIRLKQDSSLIQASPPHLYYVAEAAYQDMITEKKNQSIIISGESGSGKTESTKIILKYLAVASEILVNNCFNKNSNANLNKNEESVEKQVLDSNPLLEAFGNAKTVKNNNSSRFGKFIQVNFTEYGKIISAKIYNYLLEKSRIVKIHENERNYHIFFQLLYGANEIERSKFMLKEPTYFNYLKQGCLEVEDTDDRANFIETKECMLKLKFSSDEINLIFSVLVGILYLGNVEFTTENGATKVTENSKEDFRIASEFIGLDSQNLLKILTIRKMNDPLSKKQFEKPITIDQSYGCRDTIAKTLYSKMFDWIVKKINNAISSKEEKEKNLKMRKIGILDIFGFEIFEENSFEQLCINYANERLQQFFNNHIFKMEQEEYMREKIDWSQVTFKDNKDIIDLIDNPQKSIFSLLDSQAFIKNTNDKKLRDTIYSTLSDNKNLILNKKLPDSLIIQHYAGEVQYQIKGFIEKNDDQLNNDIVDALEGSKNKLIKYLFKKPTETSKQTNNRSVSPNKLQSDSLSKQFKKQLDELIKMLSQSNPRYVKCIKPNNVKNNGIFESLDVNRQLLSAGVLESIKIRKQGYSIRRTHEEFVRKYLPLTPGIDISKKGEKFSEISVEMIKQIANSPEFKNSFHNNTKMIQVGLNKIFMKDEVKMYLECKLNQTFMEYIVKIQSHYRKLRQMKRIKKIKEKVKKIKKVLKGFFLRKKFKNFKFKLKTKGILNEFSKNLFLNKLTIAKNIFYNYLQERKRKDSEKRKKKNSIDLLNRTIEKIEKSIDKGRPKNLKNDISKQMASPSKHNNSLNNSNLDVSTSSIKNKQLQELLSNIKGKKSKGRMEDILKPQNEIQVQQILTSEYIAKIEILNQENDSLKGDKSKLKEELLHTKEILAVKEQEIMRLKVKLHETGVYTYDESLKIQLDYLDNDMAKIKSDLERKFTDKGNNNYNSNNSNNISQANTEELVATAKSLEEEVRKFKNELYEKDSIITTMKIQLEEQTKNNKYLEDLCENLKAQVKRNKEKMDKELHMYFEQRKELENEKNLILQDSKKSLSPSKIDKRNTGLLESELKNQVMESRKENFSLEKRIEEIRKKSDKDQISYLNQLNNKDVKIHEFELKINSLEIELRKKCEEFDNLKHEYNLCKDKIPDLKNKLDNIHKSKFNIDFEGNSVRESPDHRRTKETKKFENQITDLNQTINKLKTIESTLKEQLNKKDIELEKANEFIKIYQNDYETMQEENFQLKKELTSFKERRTSKENTNQIKELESELNVYKHNVLLLEEEKNQIKKKIEREKKVNVNKSEQNYTMVDLLKVMKQEISLLQIYVMPNNDLMEKFKELKANENKVLVDLQKIAEDQLSESEPEYEDGNILLISDSDNLST